jgi:Zn-dependent protease with chaperone function/nucleoid-associated protein YgaU
MNFFEHQDQARQNTRWLIGLFILAVLCIVFTVYAAVLVTLAVTMHHKPDLWQPKLLWWVIFPTVIVIALGSLYKLRALREGGKVVAQQMGGRLITRETTDPAESQLLNVVDEMAIAAGISVPEVYVLEREQGINAFAAGFTPNTAVIGVTRGTLDQLSRDELQGVIGHEFSHILNGDMALNLQLIGLLNGILLLYMIGRIFLDMSWYAGGSVQVGSGDDKKESASLDYLLAVLGIALIVVGAIGVFFGRVIKAAVSRQREFLADASAVQFTRNPSGISGALRKIGGYAHHSQIISPYAEENSHLFFGSALPFHFLDQMFATHPPLNERIKRLEANSRTGTAASQRRSNSNTSFAEEGGVMGFAGTLTNPTSSQIAPQQVVARVGTVSPEDYDFARTLVNSLPDALQQAVRDDQEAIPVVYALVLDSQDAARQKQVEWLRQVETPERVQKTLDLVTFVDQMAAIARLPLLDLTLPVLRQKSQTQCQRLLKCVSGLAKADGRWSLAEFTLFIVLQHRLQPVLSSQSDRPESLTDLGQGWNDCLLLLSALAQVGQKGADAISYAFRSGVYRLPGASQYPLPEIPPACNFQDLQKSLQILGNATPKLKQAVVDACAHTVLLDSSVTNEEADLMRAIAIALDCPLPPFLNSINRRQGKTA